MIEVVDGVGHSEPIARISSDVTRWMTRLPERIDQFRAHMPSFRNWLALLDGEPVGEGFCLEPPDMKESSAAFGEICVLPEARRRGVGTALFVEITAHARSLGKTDLEVGAFEDDPDGVAWAERRDFTCVSRIRGLRLPLAGIAPPAVVAPDGITITTLADRPDLAHGVWEVAAEAMPDIPIDSDVPMHPGPFEDYQALTLTGARYMPEATFVALHDGEAVGFAQLAWDDRAHGIASHEMLAVRRAFRGRGVAGALKAAQIAWAVENGLTELRTGNEERNVAARAVNARYPYEPMPDFLVLRGPLPAE
jgi:mycothiol synthase